MLNNNIPSVSDLCVSISMMHNIEINYIDTFYTLTDCLTHLIVLVDGGKWHITSAEGVIGCLTKLEEELTYWKQHGVNPNV